MIWHEIKEIGGIFLLSTVKFGFGGVPAAVFAGFHFFKAVTVTTAGGVTGSIIFANISEWALDSWQKFRFKHMPYRRSGTSKSIFESKLVQTVKKKWGLAGIAFLTPFILSIPIGTMIAVRFYHDKQKVISYMLISIALWDILLFTLYNNFYKFFLPYFHHTPH